MRNMVLAAAAAALLATATPGAAARPAPRPGQGLARPAPRPGHGLVQTAGPPSATQSRDGVAHGTHPFPLPACTALSAADGDFDALPGRPGVCRDPYAPITVTARGEFRGRPVDWRKKFANPCILHAATGPVFAFSQAWHAGT